MISTDKNLSVQPNAQPTIQSDAQSTIQSDAQPTVQSDAQPTVQSDAQSMIQSDAQSTVQSDAQPTVQSDAQSTVQSDAQSTVQPDAQSTVQPNADDAKCKGMDSYEHKLLRERQLKAFGRLLDILDDLRSKCPWDRKQTLESLRPQTIEETYELSDAIMKNDLHNICKELGDLLLHVVFYAKIGEEKEAFDIESVCNQLCDKLIYRHPHIYGEIKLDNAEEVLKNWEMLKTKEKDGNKTVLSGVPDTLPSLIKAYRMQDKARAVGFDWKEKEDVWDKVEEEIHEFRETLKHSSTEHIEKSKAKQQSELGDVLFSIVNAARLYDLNPDTALEQTCSKFRSRFEYVEAHSIKLGKNLKEMTLEEMDELWEEAKVNEEVKGE